MALYLCVLCYWNALAIVINITTLTVMESSNTMPHVSLDLILCECSMRLVERPEFASFLVPLQDFSVLSIVHHCISYYE